MKKIIVLGLFLFALLAFINFNSKGKTIAKTIQTVVSSPSYINKSGNTIQTRIALPKGYKRVTYKKSSFQDYLRNYKLKPFGAKVINYDGTAYFYQSGHVGVLEMPVPKNGLQQCADALMRLRAEYLWDKNLKSKIGFQFTSGHYVSWQKYALGIRPKIKGNKVTFAKTAQADSSKNNFYKYLNLIYAYAGTLSLYTELPKIKDSKLQLGDMLVTPGTPGHIVMLIDEIENEKGEKLFLLAQGNTPSQTIHLLKNTMDTSISPWIKLKNNMEVNIPAYTFEKAKFVRFK
jgi:hypothetical protein